jgi:transposase
VDDRAVLTAIVYVLTSGCAWRYLPPSFGVAVPTAHRRFTEWTNAGLWRKLHRTVLDQLGGRGLIDWSRAVCDEASVRAEKGDPRPARTLSTEARPARRSRTVRLSRSAAVGRGVRRQHQRRRRSQTAGHGDPRRQIPPRAAPPQAAKLHADKACDHTLAATLTCTRSSPSRNRLGKRRFY